MALIVGIRIVLIFFFRNELTKNKFQSFLSLYPTYPDIKKNMCKNHNVKKRCTVE